MPVGTEVLVADYAACKNKVCGKRLACARYRMAWSERQAFREFYHENCTSFIPAHPPPFDVVSEKEADAR